MKWMMLVLGAVSLAAGADNHALPSEGQDTHLGVASCASSTCHGSVTPFRESAVMQNEFSIWQNEDPHNGAYKILLTDESKRIARNLGLGAAHEADMCLDCHADNVPAAKRGDKFQIDDGVGCEACHGGAERWLSSHASGTATHEENLELGLYPTEDSEARAELCLSCHLGNKDQMITHRIMGAGHPRLQFELDNFTWMHPHFEVDDDYVARKGELDGARDFSIGQGVAARTALQTLMDKDAGWNGIFPELVLFDCHACHRSMFNNQWEPRRSQGLGPGVVRYNDANLLMFKYVTGLVDDAAAQRLAQQTRDLHTAMRRGRGETEQAARALVGTINDALGRLDSASIGSDGLRQMVSGMVRDAEAGEFRDYAAAEQAALAIDTVINAMESDGVISSAVAEDLSEKATGLYDATSSEDDYRDKRFVSALRNLSAALP